MFDCGYTSKYDSCPIRSFVKYLISHDLTKTLNNEVNHTILVSMYIIPRTLVQKWKIIAITSQLCGIIQLKVLLSF